MSLYGESERIFRKQMKNRFRKVSLCMGHDTSIYYYGIMVCVFV